MIFKGRTVVLLICVAILFSSMMTLYVTQQGVLDAGSSADQSNEQQSPGDPSSGNPDADMEWSQLNKIEEAYRIIKNNFVSDIDDMQLLEGAIDGMMETLGDPYSVYMNTEEAQRFQESFQSVFEGIGAEVVLEDGLVTIVSPIRGSPAEDAGLQPRDQILSVNGESIEGMDLYEAVLKIRGPKGTEAELEVLRPGLSQPMRVSVIRDKIPLETIYTETIEEQGQTIGLIQISTFAESTAMRFAEELNHFERQGMDALIIDVRGNPGGYLDAVNQIGQLLVPNQSVITQIKDREGEMSSFRSSLQEPKPYPIAILTNNGSASASEILAAALKESGGYPVIGQTTFGKGTVQNAIRLQDQSEIKITIAQWLTPQGHSINENGVTPDFEVSHPEYFNALRIATDPVLRIDVNSEEVLNLQRILNGLGYETNREDGYFDEQTQAAVQQFQEEHTLNQSGEVDEDTARKIEEVLMEHIMDSQNDRQLSKAIEVVLSNVQE